MRASAVIAIVLTVATVGWMLSGRIVGERTEPQHSAPGSGETADPSPRVRVERIRARSHPVAIMVRGRTEASRRVDVRAETDGRIVEIGASRGSAVAKGDLLARLAVEERRAKIEEYRARLRLRQIHYEATEALAKKGLSSKEALATAKADIDAAKAAVQQVEVEIDRTRLRAPFDGVLLEGHAEIGGYLKKGDHFGRIIDLDPVLFVGSVTERTVAWLRPGLAAVARSLDGQTVRGTLKYIAPSADLAARTYRIEVEAENPQYRIREGLTADITIEVETRMAHFVTPALLTLADDGAIGLKTVDERNRVRFRPVEIVEDTPEGVWLAGLPDQVRVITVGQDFVVAGQVVEPVDSDDDGPDTGIPATASPVPAGPVDAAVPASDDPGTPSAATAAVPRSAS